LLLVVCTQGTAVLSETLPHANSWTQRRAGEGAGNNLKEDSTDRVDEQPHSHDHDQ